MARKRYITTDISLSGKVEALAKEAGEYAVLLWTWMIPHLDDWCRMEGEADKVFYAVTPRFANLGRGPEDAEKALEAMARIGLLQRYEVQGKAYIQVDEESFYELQTYIPQSKRGNDKSKCPPPPSRVAQSSTQSHRVAQNAPSPSPSPTPSSVQRSSAATDLPSTTNATAADEVAAAAESESKHSAGRNLIQDQFAHLTGRIMPSPVDVMAIREALQIASDRADLVLTVMDTASKAYKPKYEGDRIQSFRYFVPIVRETVARLEAEHKTLPSPARAAPATPEEQERITALTQELLSVMPADLLEEMEREGGLAHERDGPTANSTARGAPGRPVACR